MTGLSSPYRNCMPFTSTMPRMYAGIRRFGRSFVKQKATPMNFWQRLGRYGVGIAIGIVLSLYFFGGRGCGSWLPSAQICTTVLEGGLTLSEEVARAHPELEVSDLIPFVGAADVDFGASGPRDTPQWYVLRVDAPTGDLAEVEVVLLDTASLVRRVSFQD